MKLERGMKVMTKIVDGIKECDKAWIQCNRKSTNACCKLKKSPNSYKTVRKLD